MASTPLRNVRIADDPWLPARRIADARGETVSDVVRDALTRYVRRHRDLDPGPDGDPADD